jgi:hypothetical protein
LIDEALGNELPVADERPQEGDRFVFAEGSGSRLNQVFDDCLFRYRPDAGGERGDILSSLTEHA